MGMPVSAAPSPFARRVSAHFASSMARSSSTVMNAFKAPLSLAMRARQARVSSSEDTRFAASVPASSVTVALSKLLNDLGNEVEASLYGGGDRLKKLAPVWLAHLVGAQSLHEIERMGHGVDAGGIYGADLFYQAKHSVQALEHLGRFLRLDAEAGEAGEALDVVGS